jgi:hypothetical protein
MSTRTRSIVISIVGVAAIVSAVIALGPTKLTRADEEAYQTPFTVADPWSVVPTFSPDELKAMKRSVEDTPKATLIVGPISEAQAIAIAMEVATMKGDPAARLTSIKVRPLWEAVADLSPGTELYGYPVDMLVFDVRFSGGPFEHARTKPISRAGFDTTTMDLFVVVSVEDGEVIGTGGIRKD